MSGKSELHASAAVAAPIAIVARPTAGVEPAVESRQPREREPERNGDREREHRHPEDRAQPEKKDIEEPGERTWRGRKRQNDEGRRAGHSVHQTDGERAPGHAAGVGVTMFGVSRFAAVRVPMEVSDAFRVIVNVEMHAVADESAQHVGSEPYEHQAHREL